LCSFLVSNAEAPFANIEEEKILHYFTRNYFMRWLSFFARVAFICNLFFILCLLLRHTHFTIPPGFNEFVIITGWVLSVFINAIFALWVAVVALNKKETGIPRWLLVVNLFLFLFQIFYRVFSTR
jgi:hypothetical protein